MKYCFSFPHINFVWRKWDFNMQRDIIFYQNMRWIINENNNFSFALNAKISNTYCTSYDSHIMSIIFKTKIWKLINQFKVKGKRIWDALWLRYEKGKIKTSGDTMWLQCLESEKGKNWWNSQSLTVYHLQPGSLRS